MKKSNIEKLKEQREQLNSRIQKLEAAEKHREKKRETRRKILVGAYYLHEARQNHTFDELTKKMDTFLTRKSDRLLFELEISPSEPVSS